MVASAQSNDSQDGAPTSVASSDRSEEVVRVRATRPRYVEREPELASTVISREELQRPGASSASVLSGSPGVQVNQTGSSAELSTLSIRGASASQVPVYLAGIRLNDDIVGVADLSRIPLWMVQRAEVYRSAAPLHLPRGGLSGAAIFEPELPQKDGLRAGALAGSFGTGAAWIGATKIHGSPETDAPYAATSLSIRRRGSQNNFTYLDDSGTAFDNNDDSENARANADFTDTDLWLVSRARVPMAEGVGTLTAFVGSLFREQGATGLSLAPAEQARESTRQGLFGLSAQLPCRLSGTPCRFESSTGASFASLQTSDPLRELSLGTFLVTQQNDRVSQTMSFMARPASAVEGMVSATYESSRLLRDSEEGAWVRAQGSFVAATGSVSYSPDGVLIRAMGRGSCSSDDGVDTGGSSLLPPSDDAGRCAPEARLGVHYELLEGVDVRTTFIRGVRFATLGELYGVSSTTRGNPNLELEKSWGADVGARFVSSAHSWGDAWADGSAYLRFDQDLVAYQRSALGYVRPYNVGHSRFVGAELAAEVDAWSHLRARSAFSLMDPRDISAGTASAPLIPYRSPATLSQELEAYIINPTILVSRVGLLGRLDYRSSRTADPAGLIVIPQNLTLDLNLAVQLKNRVGFQGRIENVFNSQRFDLLGLPLPGRSMYLSAELRL